MKFEPAKSMLQESSGEQMSTFQKELEQLHTSTGQMKVDLQATQHSQIGTQAPDPCPAVLAMPLMRLALLPNSLDRFAVICRRPVYSLTHPCAMT